jgi:methionine-rich copper-binding protein CopC
MQMSGPVMKSLFFLLATLFFLQLDSGSALAHAVVIESHPKDGEELSQAPAEIVLRFNARIEKRLVSVDLTSGDRTSIPLPATRRNENKAEDRLVVKLPPLTPGIYFLRYKILSTDGHSTLGRLKFIILEGH